MNKLNLAFDKSSARSYDGFGRLHVSLCNISKANVCPYYGREIPDADSMGLDPDKIYQLLRDPEELEKAAPTSNNIQLLATHIPVTVDEPQKQVVVGSTGTDAKFEKPFLKNSLVVWDAVAIAGIESDEQKELSCGYSYKADMTPGTYEGVSYDGVMRDIVFNHVALVEQGRAGSDVVVGDSILETSMSRKITLSRKAAMAKGALAVFLKPKLANDAKIDLNPILEGVTPKNWATKKSQIVAAIKVAAKGKLAQDADIADIVKLLDTLDGEELGDGPDDNLGTDTDPADQPNPDDKDDKDPDATDADPIAKVREFLKGKLSDDDFAAVEALLASPANDDLDADGNEDDLLTKIQALLAEGKSKVPGQDEPPETPGAAVKPATSKEKPMGSPDKAAMDAAIKTAVKEAENNTMKRMRDIAEAKEIVRPIVGEISLAMDSAEAIYRLALDEAEVDLTDVDPSAFKAMVKMLGKQADSPKVDQKLAQDHSVVVTDFAKRFPEAASVRHLG